MGKNKPLAELPGTEYRKYQPRAYTRQLKSNRVPEEEGAGLAPRWDCGLRLSVPIFSLVTSDCCWSGSRGQVPERSLCSEQHAMVTVHASLTLPGVISFRKGSIKQSIECHPLTSLSLESGACKRRERMFYHFSVPLCLLGGIINIHRLLESLKRECVLSSKKQTMTEQSS